MQFLTRKIQKFYNKEIDGTALALFRISFCLIMMLEIVHSLYFSQMIFGTPTIVISLTIWLIILAFLTVGLFTRIMAGLNYIICITIILQQLHGYHMNYLYFGVSFFFLFLPVSRRLSIDNLLTKLKYSNAEKLFTTKSTVTSLSYFLPLLLGPGLEYMDSAINWKMISPVWMSGLGMWLPGSTPYLIHADLSFILNMKYLNIFCGYLTLAFELLFVFLFWFKKFRYPLTIVGLGLHLGIFIFFPIPLFAVGVSCFYFLLLPVGIWNKIFSWFVRKNRPKTIFTYNPEIRSQLNTRIIVEHFDIFKRFEFVQTSGSAVEISLTKKSGKTYNGFDAIVQVLFSLGWTSLLGVFVSIPGIKYLFKSWYQKSSTSGSAWYSYNPTPVMLTPTNRYDDLRIKGIKYGLITIIFIQFCMSWNFGLMSKISDRIGIHENFILRKFGKVIFLPAKIFFGLGQHAVFMDNDYYGYEIKVSYLSKDNKKTTLPIIRDNGLAGGYIYGPNYVNYLFACSNKNGLEQGRNLTSTFDEQTINRFLGSWIKFWMDKHHIQPNDGTFVLDIKDLDIPDHWVRNELKIQMAKPWYEIGRFNFSDENNLHIIFNSKGKAELGRFIRHDL